MYNKPIQKHMGKNQNNIRYKMDASFYYEKWVKISVKRRNFTKRDIKIFTAINSFS